MELVYLSEQPTIYLGQAIHLTISLQRIDWHKTIRILGPWLDDLEDSPAQSQS